MFERVQGGWAHLERLELGARGAAEVRRRGGVRVERDEVDQHARAARAARRVVASHLDGAQESGELLGVTL